jgi:hypothetical protein
MFQMIREDMATAFLRSLTQISSMDSAIRQTVEYSLHKIVGALEGVPMTPSLHGSIVDTRSWMWSLQAQADLRF